MRRGPLYVLRFPISLFSSKNLYIRFCYISGFTLAPFHVMRFYCVFSLLSFVYISISPLCFLLLLRVRHDRLCKRLHQPGLFVEPSNDSLEPFKRRLTDKSTVIYFFHNEELIVGPRSNDISTMVQRYVDLGPTISRPWSND